ncbi:hypothetical protein CTA2_9462 [Colletotrichum tanaceti]|uniref:Uncharacterized protein n=1 Tax=Colletotrichum tanaceti TaxID=1306861 RepID=A0A4U6X112_9PEZI|nr:hypothetical protein CTA2_9462 [Colletotrichum tanaceti]TKW48684.1 hypothetical protein CTA1_11014 [Colletotrichum tanaceti]
MGLSPDTRALYARAVENPTRLSLAEQNRVLGRPPPEEEDELCLARVGIDRQAVISKALTEPDTLSHTECDIVLTGAHYHSSNPSALNLPLDVLVSLSPEECQLQSQAYGEVRRVTEWHNTEEPAVHNAFERSRAIREQERAERKREREQQVELVQTAMGLPRPKWIQDVLDAQLPRWGFVCFRTGYATKGDDDAAPAADDAAWDQLRWTLDDIAQLVLTHWWKRDGPRLYETCEHVFVSDPDLKGASPEHLRARFRTMRDGNEIPEGVRRDCFLVADADALTCDYIAQKKEYRGGRDWVPHVKALDPDYDEATGPLTGGFAGEINVPLPKISDWLHYTLFSHCETWQERHRQTTQETWQPIRTAYAPYPAYTGVWGGRKW